MATIKPFRGVRYNLQLIEPARAISQPYDRIHEELQQQYYALSPYNIVRIIHGEERPDDAPEVLEGPNVYTRARDYYTAWRREGVLIRDPEPAIYVYHQDLAVDGQPRTRRGFIAALELSPFEAGIVLPHERTHAAPKLDRLRLLQTLAVHTGQIFILYHDPQQRISALLEQAIAGRVPDVDAVELYEHEVRQRLWRINDPAVITAVQDEMAPQQHMIIADGHHRYETALTYRDQMRARHPDLPDDAALNYAMVTLVSMDDPGLVILPTHREVLDHPDPTPDQILTRAEQVFTVQPAADLTGCLAAMQAHAAEHAFGFYASGRYHVLVLRYPALIDQWMTEERAWAWKTLDVSIAHRILLEAMGGLSEAAVEAQRCLRYHRDPRVAIASVDAGEGNWCLLLNPTRIEQVKACAEQGEKMPQKSTDFYPKMVTGLTMLPVNLDERL